MDDYLTHARRLVTELLDLGKKAPGWWHASQVQGAREMLGSTICIFELEQEARAAAKVEKVVASPTPTPAPAEPESKVSGELEEQTVIYDEAVPADWSE